MSDLDEFRRATRAWLIEHCPASMRTPMIDNEAIHGGRKHQSPNPDAYYGLNAWLPKAGLSPTGQ